MAYEADREAALTEPYPAGLQTVHENGATSTSLSSKSIQLTDIPHELSRRLPRYPHLPATLLDRLTTDLSARGVGLARFLLIDAMVRAVKSEIAPAAFIVDAKDEAAVRFYERESFLRLPESRTRLVRRMSDIEAVLRS